MQRVYNYADSLRMYMSLPMGSVSVPKEPMADEDEGEGEDFICVHCHSADASEANEILICEGAHSATLGWHQLCLTPPLDEVPDGCWLCPECVSAWSGPGSCLADPNYTPARASTEASATSGSTSNSNSDSSSNSNSGSSSDSDCDSDSDSGSDSVTLTRSCGSHERPWWALHTCVAGIDRGPSVLKHKYHRHLNHEGPEGGFVGSRQLSLWGGGSSQGALSTPPPPKCKPGYPMCIPLLVRREGFIMRIYAINRSLSMS